MRRGHLGSLTSASHFRFCFFFSLPTPKREKRLSYSTDKSRACKCLSIKGGQKEVEKTRRISRGLRAAVLTRASLSRRVRGKPSSESSIIASVVITHAPAPRGAFSAPSDLRLCFLQTTTLLRPRHFRVDTIFFFFFFSAKSYYHKRRPRGKPPKKSSFLAQHPLQLLLGISPLIPCGSF